MILWRFHWWNDGVSVKEDTAHVLCLSWNEMYSSYPPLWFLDVWFGDYPKDFIDEMAAYVTDATHMFSSGWNVLFVSSTLTWECPERPEQRELPRFETVYTVVAPKQRSNPDLLKQRSHFLLAAPNIGCCPRLSWGRSGFGQPSAAHHLWHSSIMNTITYSMVKSKQHCTLQQSLHSILLSKHSRQNQYLYLQLLGNNWK